MPSVTAKKAGSVVLGTELMGQGARGDGDSKSGFGARWLGVKVCGERGGWRVWCVVCKTLEAIENWQSPHMTSSELHFRY